MGFAIEKKKTMKTISDQDAEILVRVMPILRSVRLTNLTDENTRRRAVLALRRLERKINLTDEIKNKN